MAGIELRLFKMTNAEYQRGVAIDNYNGTISLVSAKSNEKGIWKDWCFPQVYNNGENVPKEKAVPWKIELGKGKKEALETLQFFINLLNGETTQGSSYQPPPDFTPPPEPPEDDDSIPF